MAKRDQKKPITVSGPATLRPGPRKRSLLRRHVYALIFLVVVLGGVALLIHLLRSCGTP
jgi:hypothetical protein